MCYNNNGGDMKILRIFPMLLIFFMVGCGNEKEMDCNLTVNNPFSAYTSVQNYKICYKGDFVTSIDKQENYISDDNNTIEYFYESRELEYYDLSDKYGGVIYKVEKGNNNVSLTANINLGLLDINKMVKDGKIDKDYVVNGKLTITGLKKIYEKKGFTCK